MPLFKRGNFLFNEPMQKAIDERIRTELHKEELPDYRLFVSGEGLKAYGKMLERALKEAEDSFGKLRALPPVAATFASVVEPFWSLDKDVGHLWSFMENYDRTDGNKRTRAIMESFRPKLVRSYDCILLDARFYRLLKRVEKTPLDPLQRRSLELLLRNMEMAGVHLAPAGKKRLKAINRELSQLCERFGKNMTDSRAVFFHSFETDKALRELPPQDLALAAQEAKKRKLRGWVFTLSPPSHQAIMRYCTDRRMRRLFYEENGKVASRGKHDNRPVALRILALRREKALLLGKRDYAEWILQERMAGSVREILGLVRPYADHCRRKARAELSELRAFGKLATLCPWDVSYMAQKYKKQAFKISDRELREYFPLPQTVDGLFRIVAKLYGVRMRPLAPSARYRTDVRSYEVLLGKRTVGYFLLDLFARPNKRVGAWSGCLREPMTVDGRHVPPVVINVASFTEGAKGEQPLLSHVDVETIFHEFGHALHEMLSDVPYRNLDGYHTEWDFVELPSQLTENWCWDAASLALFARHLRTGKVLPPRLLASLLRSKNFLAGFGGLAQCEYSLLDLLLHTSPVPRSVAALDRMAREHTRKMSLLPVPASQRRYASFHHIFDGGYAAGYYSYLWAEVLEADIFAHWKRRGALGAAVGRKFLRTVLSRGASKPGMELFRDFMGRGPRLEALLRKQGFKR